RTITVPELLPFFDVQRAIRVLLSPAERRRPWLLYLTPGVLPIVLLQLACDRLSLPLARAVSRFVAGHGGFAPGVSTRTLIELGCVLLQTAVSTPLEVIAVRLATQRNRPAISFGGEGVDMGTGEETAKEVLTAEERVIKLRTDQPLAPYTGVWDCARCIVNEEGLGALYRAWWCTLVLSLYSWGTVADGSTVGRPELYGY
ncbi:hypothetical protein BU15DRAFT_50653, partial [Melanogaster broomeanus]